MCEGRVAMGRRSVGRLRFDEDAGRFAFAPGEAVAAELDFDGVAERGDAHELARSAGEQAHLTQADEGDTGLGQRADGGGLADGEFGELQQVGHERAWGAGRLPGRSGRSAQVGDGLDADLAGGLVAEGDAAAVDLAEDGAVAGDLGDEDAFAEAHLAHALAKGGVAGEGHYPADAAGRQLAQRQVVGTMTLGSGFRHDREGLYELRLSFIVNAGSSLEADKGSRRVTFSAGRAPWV